MHSLGLKHCYANSCHHVVENIVDMTDPINPGRVFKYYINQCHPDNERFIQKPATNADKKSSVS